MQNERHTLSKSPVFTTNTGLFLLLDKWEGIKTCLTSTWASSEQIQIILYKEEPLEMPKGEKKMPFKVNMITLEETHIYKKIHVSW